MNNDDGEISITDNQSEEIRDPDRPKPADQKAIYSEFFFYLHGIIFNLTIRRFNNES